MGLRAREKHGLRRGSHVLVSANNLQQSHIRELHGVISDFLLAEMRIVRELEALGESRHAEAFKADLTHHTNRCKRMLRHAATANDIEE